jgi:hypothetical protein
LANGLIAGHTAIALEAFHMGACGLRHCKRKLRLAGAGGPLQQQRLLHPRCQENHFGYGRVDLSLYDLCPTENPLVEGWLI